MRLPLPLVAACAGLAACAAPPPVAPQPSVSAAPPPRTGLVVAARPLAPPALRSDVLLALSGAPAQAGGATAGVELIVATGDGHTIACIAHGTAAARPGATVTLQPGAGCTTPAATLRRGAQSGKRPLA